MADANEGIAVPGEEGVSSQNPNADKYEGAARKAGWKPESEWDGSPEDWVPAKEFVGRQKLFDKIHDLKSQLSRQTQKFEKEMAQVSAHMAKVQEIEYKKAKRELEAKLAAAKADEDVDAAIEIAQEIKDVEQEQRVAQAAQQQAKQGGPTPEFTEWQAANKWFGADMEMTADAVAIGTGYAAANPTKSQKEVLEYTRKKVAKMYPEKFEDDGEPARKSKTEDRVEGPSRGAPNGQKKKGQLTVADLSDTERRIMTTLIKRNVLKDAAKKNNRTQQEEYLAQLAERKGAGE